MCQIKVELGLGGVENWTQPAIPLPFPGRTWGIWHTLQSTVRKPNSWSNSTFSLTRKQAQKCDIVTVVGAELPPAFLSPFPSAQWERICGSIWPNSECWRHRVLVQNMWPFFPIADDSLLDGPFPLSCLFLNCFSYYWKHLLCGSNIFSEPWGQIAAM